jgi:hypothetical protein
VAGVATALRGLSTFTTIACPSTSLCVGGDTAGQVWTLTDPTAETVSPTAAGGIDPGIPIAGIACPLVVIQRPLGQHADLGITSTYLRGIDNTETIHAVHEGPTPMISATGRLWFAAARSGHTSICLNGCGRRCT